MLKKLELKNFRSHEHTVLEFDKGVNVLVGRSRSGKTNIVRALWWLIYNRPRGFDFHSAFTEQKFTEVKATFSDPEAVVSIRKTEAGGAEYRVGEQSWKKVGTNVPDEVQRILNMNEINISEQLTLPYLVCESPGVVGKEINKIAKMENVDNWLSALTSKINGENRDVKLLQEQEKELQEEVERLKDIEKLRKEVDKLLQKQEKVTEIEKQENELTGLIRQYEELRDDLKVLEQWLQVKDEVEKIEKDLIELEKVQEEEQLLDDLIDLSENIKGVEEFLKVKPEVEKLEKSNKELYEVNSEILLLDQWVDGYENVIKSNKEVKDKLGETKNQFREYLLEVGVCPTCYAEIGEEDVDEIIAHV